MLQKAHAPFKRLHMDLDSLNFGGDLRHNIARELDRKSVV